MPSVDDFVYELPPRCPPASAVALESEVTVYRLINGTSLTEKDLLPYKILYPTRSFRDECKAMALSVFKTEQSLQNKRKLTGLKNLNHVCKIRLNNGDGMVNDDKDGHCSWWRSKSFSIGSHSEVIS